MKLPRWVGVGVQQRITHITFTKQAGVQSKQHQSFSKPQHMICVPKCKQMSQRDQKNRKDTEGKKQHSISDTQSSNENRGLYRQQIGRNCSRQGETIKVGRKRTQTRSVKQDKMHKETALIIKQDITNSKNRN